MKQPASSSSSASCDETHPAAIAHGCLECKLDTRYCADCVDVRPAATATASSSCGSETEDAIVDLHNRSMVFACATYELDESTGQRKGGFALYRVENQPNYSDNDEANREQSQTARDCCVMDSAPIAAHHMKELCWHSGSAIFDMEWLNYEYLGEATADGRVSLHRICDTELQSVEVHNTSCAQIHDDAMCLALGFNNEPHQPITYVSYSISRYNSQLPSSRQFNNYRNNFLRPIHHHHHSCRCDSRVAVSSSKGSLDVFRVESILEIGHSEPWQTLEAEVKKSSLQEPYNTVL